MGEQDQFWGPGGEKKPATGKTGDGEFWGKATAKVEEKRHAKTREAVGVEPGRPPAKRMGLGRKVLFGGLGTLVVLLLLAVVFLPNIAAAVAPGIISSQAQKQINGTVNVTGVSLSWSGPQRIGQVVVRSADGKEVANLQAVATLGLLDVVGGLGDLGEVRLSGRASLVRNADGTTTIDQLLKDNPAEPAPSTAPGPSEPTTLPQDLKVRVVVDKLDVDLRDEMLAQQTSGAVAGVEVRDFSGTALVQVGGPAQVDLKAQTNTLGSGGTAIAGGALVIQGQITNWSSNSGKLTLETANVDASVKADDLSMAVIDAIAGLNGKLTQAVGSRLDATLVAKGGLDGGVVDIKAQGPNLVVDAQAVVKDNMLTTPAPITIRASGEGLNAFRADIEKALGPDRIMLGAMPNVSVALSDVRIKLPRDAQPLDLRGSSLNLVAETTGVQGTMKLDAAGQAQPFEIQPFRAEVRAPDLGGKVDVKAATSASIGGQPAGSLNVDMTAAGLLNPAGAPVAGMPASLNGTLALTNLRTELAQPFVASTGLNLPADIGPTLDLQLVAQTAQAADATPGAIPPTTLEFKAASNSLKADGGVQVSGNAVRSIGDGITLRLQNAASVAARLAPADSGLSIVQGNSAGAGELTARVTGLQIPLDQERKPIAGKAEGRVEIGLGPAALRLADKTTGQTNTIDVSRLNATAVANPAASPRIELNSLMAYAGQPFTLEGGFDLAGLFGTDGVTLTPERVRPLGRLDIKGLPTALAQLVPAAPAENSGAANPQGGAAKPALDLAALLRDVVGPSADVSVATQPSKQLDAGMDVLASVRSNGVNADVAGAFNQAQLAVKTAQVDTTLSPATFQNMLRTFAPGLAGPQGAPRLASPARAVVTLEPFSVPMQDGAPNFTRLDSISLNASMPGNVIVEGLALGGQAPASGNNAGAPASPPAQLGPVGVSQFQLQATLPGSVLGGGDAVAAKPMQASLSTQLLGAAPGAPPTAAERMANVTVQVNGNLMGTTPTGQLNVNAGVRGLASATADRVLAPVLGLAQGDVGLASGALGETADIILTATLDPPSERRPGWAPAKATIGIEAPRVTTNRPLELVARDNVLALADSAELTIDPDPAFLTAMVSPADQTGARSLVVENIGRILIDLKELAIARPDDPSLGPLQPGVFKLAADMSVRSALVRLDDGKRLRVEGLNAEVRTKENNVIDFVLGIGSTQLTDASGQAQPAAEQSQLQATIRNLADPRGNVSPDTAVISATGSIPALPTALVDALANQNGMLVAALGPTIQMDIRADQLTLNPANRSGSLRASAVSSRAQASVAGRLEGNVFATDAPLEVKVVEITSELSSKLVQGVPFIESIDKTTEFQPATVVGENLRIPLDNNLSNLNGKLMLDPGELRFKTGGTFARFLKVAKIDNTTRVGNKLQPLTVNFENGVARYDRYVLPIGEFSFESEGQINLVQNTIDTYTYIPFAALTDEAGQLFMGAMNNIPGLGSAIDALTLMPFRTTGPLSNPQTRPDVERFAKEFIKNVRPDNVIKKGVDILKDTIKLPGAK